MSMLISANLLIHNMQKIVIRPQKANHSGIHKNWKQVKPKHFTPM